MSRLEDKFDYLCSHLNILDDQEKKDIVRMYANAIAQECYLECVAVERGEGACAKAIATKLPRFINRLVDNT